MFAEIITIGDELLIGQVVDTNSAWIGHELNCIGIEVLRITSVRDRKEEIVEAIDSAMERANIVLVTGGLGPTKDDITKQVLCDYFQTELIFNDTVLANIKRILGDRVPINGLNQSQAMVPKDCEVINNRVGTASVSWFERHGKVLVSMPGVPQEMKVVMSEEILPRLQKYSTNDYIVHKTFLVKNYPESVLAETLEPWETALPECIKLAYLPKLGIIRLRLTARGENENILLDTLEKESLKLKEILKLNIMADSDLSLEQLIGIKLKDKGLTVATAESCTGGNIAARITSIPGCSSYFKGSVVAYSNEIKTRVLGVNEGVLNSKGAVSEETVIEMVKGAMSCMNTDCAIATSGIAGPDGGTKDKPVGTVWIAVAYKDEIRTMKQSINRGREMNIERAGNNAFMLLLDIL